MEYLHIKNLEKYHPGYKDRTLQWAKIFFKAAQGDPDWELIDNEIDWGRLVKFILLELQAQQPIPLDLKYLAKKGFNLKKRSISLTVRMLHNFITTDTQLSEVCVLDKEEDKEKDKEKEGLTPSRTQFKKPTPSEVVGYAKSIGFELDGNSFCDFYETRGWKLKGGLAMKDWQAAVRTWRSRDTAEVKKKQDATLKPVCKFCGKESHYEKSGTAICSSKSECYKKLMRS